MPMTLGVISDTHGLLRPKAVEQLGGSDHIIHAGDIGSPEIIAELQTIAPVTAIRGNIDTQAWARQFPETEAVELAGKLIYIIHDVSALDINPQTAGFAAVISGHSHQAGQEVRNGVLYFNPGSARPRRFKLPVTVGRLEITGNELTATVITIA
ncbi:MAG TPA: metallophosphoesterase family protein [Terriglobales bacterium]